jgi:hypothetical protein
VLYNVKQYVHHLIKNVCNRVSLEDDTAFLLLLVCLITVSKLTSFYLKICIQLILVAKYLTYLGPVYVERELNI